MKLRSIAASLPLLAAACAMQPGVDAGKPVAIEREAVTYSTQPCYGTCPVYTVTITPQGEGVFTGIRHTWTTGERRFTVGRDEAARFIAHLGAVRPARGNRRIEIGSPDCGPAMTDSSAIEVRWESNTGAPPQTVYSYRGCRSDEAQRVWAVLDAAPDLLLPITTLIGKR